jgi:hypothetical protein
MPTEHAPNVWARLSGTAPRLASVAALAVAKGNGARSSPAGGWSIAEHIGHLGDLEPLSLVRLDDYDAGATTLRAADMTNRDTTAAGHNTHSPVELAERFAVRRAELLQRIAAVPLPLWDRSALHPRLGIPMRMVDLLVFVAEHDDHHLAEINWLLAQDT